MPKKKEPELKNLLNKYFWEFISFILTSLEEETEDLLKKFRDWINFKKRLQKPNKSFGHFQKNKGYC